MDGHISNRSDRAPSSDVEPYRGDPGQSASPRWSPLHDEVKLHHQLPRIAGIATAVPSNPLPQDAVTELAAETFGARFADFDRLRPVFQNSGIRTRYSVQPLEWFRRSRNWRERTAAYLEGATELFVRTAAAALADAGIEAHQIDSVVTVSSTGIATPSLEARAQGILGLRSDVRRVPLFGLGCAGGATGLALAARLAAADPGSHVLLVVVELCTLAFRDDELSKSNVIATALFGDGAAALVLTADGRSDGPRITASGEHLWPESLDVMGWRVDPQGFGAIFSVSIPHLVSNDMREVTEGFLARHEERISQIQRFICHPGGTKVVEALERAFALPSHDLDVERGILRDFGNMSAPTVLFVLERKMAAGLSGQSLLCALGPGFTASFVRIDA